MEKPHFPRIVGRSAYPWALRKVGANVAKRMQEPSCVLLNDDNELAYLQVAG